MRKLMFLTVVNAAFALAACSRNYDIAEYQVAQRCASGTIVYKLPAGGYAISDGQEIPGETHLVPLADGMSPEKYCGDDTESTGYFDVPLTGEDLTKAENAAERLDKETPDPSQAPSGN